MNYKSILKSITDFLFFIFILIILIFTFAFWCIALGLLVNAFNSL